MDQTSQYIQQHRAQGYTDQQLRDQFLAHGWTLAQVDQALAVASAAIQLPNPVELQHSTNDAEQPKKYKIYRALLDTVRAVRANPIASVCVLSISIIVYIAVFALLFVIVAALFKDTELLFDPKTFFIKLLVSLSLLLLFYALATSFFVSTSSIALRDGLHKQKSSIKHLLLNGLRASPRIALMNVISGMITFIPFFAILIGAFVFQIRSAITGSGSAIGVIVAVVLAFIWLLIVSLRLSIVQQVAVFEPHLSVRQTLKRSSFLLRVGGQWFIVKGFVLLIIISIALNAADKHHVNEFVTGFASLLVSILSVTSLTMLYLNRAAIRGTAEN